MFLKKQFDVFFREVILLREGEVERKFVRKEIFKREFKKVKLDRFNIVVSFKDCQEFVSIFVGFGLRFSLDL